MTRPSTRTKQVGERCEVSWLEIRKKAIVIHQCPWLHHYIQNYNLQRVHNQAEQPAEIQGETIMMENNRQATKTPPQDAHLCISVQMGIPNKYMDAIFPV